MKINDIKLDLSLLNWREKQFRKINMFFILEAFDGK